jgi:hypothetical protein
MKKLLLTTSALLGLISITQAQKTHKIGEKFEDGIVFDVTPDGQHGLIAKTQDEGMCSWNEARALVANLAKQRAASKSAAGWRLPKKDELDKLFERRQIVGGFTSNRYWSATENGKDLAWNQIFASGAMAANGKGFSMYVRAIRKF